MENPENPNNPKTWFGVHLGLSSPAQLQQLVDIVPGLAAQGVNVLVAEVNYNFAFTAHPELRGPDPISPVDAKSLVEVCRSHGIRLIPQFMCLGHQSWAEQTFPLLAHYTELDETPGQFPGNQGIYCRSWCPRHPQVNPIIFTLMGELAGVFEADALHVGMDEVFLIASEHCPRCRGADPGEIFAAAVNDYHTFVSGQLGLEMLMWGDRLLDDRLMGYGKWEADQIGTHSALPNIPRDIILCDWHYEPDMAYPSVEFFAREGFRVWPAGWRNVQATEALLRTAQSLNHPNVLGHLCTTWGAVKIPDIPRWAPFQAARKVLVR